MKMQAGIDKKNLLKLLLEKDMLSRTQLDGLAMETGGMSETMIRSLLLERRLVEEEALYATWAEYLELPYIDLQTTTFGPEALAMVSSDVARRHLLIPFSIYSAEISIAFENLDVDVIDDLRRQTGCDVLAHIATKSAIQEAIAVQYGTTDVQTTVEKIDLSEYSSRKFEDGAVDVSGPIVDVANGLIRNALEDRASDIHIEPRENYLNIRFRVDGMMREKYRLDRAVARPLASRYKIMADLDIAEKRIPQDGRIRHTVKDDPIDIRVSIVPGIYGEKTVLRLLDRSGPALDLRQMLFSWQIYHRLERIVSVPHGIFFVTGPTGSGKTTTLYAIISHINSSERNITTIEDPVEYRLPLINQIQVNPDIGLDFPTALRSVLRQDPDVILVGETRDAETAEAATAAAMTGHLVLSTLHTNNAIEAVLRLVEIGVEAFMVAPSLVGVMSQRLVRRICNKCRKKYVAEAAERVYFGLSDEGPPLQLCGGNGCPACAGTGYVGRLAIHELLVVTNEIRELILQQAPSHRIARAAHRTGYRSMRFDGLKKALRGFTTLSEVLRVTTAQEDFLLE